MLEDSGSIVNALTSEDKALNILIKFPFNLDFVQLRKLNKGNEVARENGGLQVMKLYLINKIFCTLVYIMKGDTKKFRPEVSLFLATPLNKDQKIRLLEALSWSSTSPGFCSYDINDKKSMEERSMS